MPFSTDADSRIITVGSDIELICSLPDVPHTSTWYFTPSDEVKSRELTTSHRVKVSYICILSIWYVVHYTALSIQHVST